MAVTETDYLHINKGGNAYLLLKNPTHFHLIRVDANLTESIKNRLFRLYPCSDTQLRKLGVHFSSFKTANLRRVVITGYQTGDALELWLGGDVRSYQLGSDYSDEVLAHFFKDHLITRRSPPKWEGLDHDVIRKITRAVNCAGIICAILFYIIRTPYKLWSTLCVLSHLTAFFLVLFFPASFTLADDSRKTKLYLNKGKGHLLPAFAATGCVLSLRALTDFTFRNNTIYYVILVTAILSFVLIAIYAWRNQGLRSGLISAGGAAVLVAFFSLGSIGQMNYLLDFNYADRQIVQVLDTRTSGTKTTSYYCTVELPNGEAMELTIPAGVYRNIQVGEDVAVTHHDGAFQIPFTTVEALPEDHNMG